MPKQECMVELDKLPLVLSTESIESISLSGSYKLTSDSHNGLIARRRCRKTAAAAPERPDLSLSGLFEEEVERRTTKKTVIPHWVGGRGQPTYPVTHDYARMTLLVHKPWMEGTITSFRRTKDKWIQDFNDFVNSLDCPKSVKIACTRVRERKLKKRQCEPTAEDEECFDYEAHHHGDMWTTRQGTFSPPGKNQCPGKRSRAQH